MGWDLVRDGVESEARMQARAAAGENLETKEIPPPRLVFIFFGRGGAARSARAWTHESPLATPLCLRCASAFADARCAHSNRHASTACSITSGSWPRKDSATAPTDVKVKARSTTSSNLMLNPTMFWPPGTGHRATDTRCGHRIFYAIVI